MSIYDAISRLWYWYDIALKSDWVEKKVAWAFYQTWKEVDAE